MKKDERAGAIWPNVGLTKDAAKKNADYVPRAHARGGECGINAECGIRSGELRAIP